MLMRRDGSVLVALNSGAILQFDREGKFGGPLLGGGRGASERAEKYE